MILTSPDFYVFLAISIILYYVVPKKIQWIVLLISGIVWFALSVSNLWSAGYVLLTTILVSFSVYLIKKSSKAAKAVVVITVLTNVLLLVLLRYIALLPAVPMGISYYTLVAIGYVLDNYWGVAKGSANPAKNLLYISYYPFMTSGPIARYEGYGTSLFEGHSFSYERLCFGAQRILFGVFKKLCIAPRAAVIVDTIYADPEKYRGFYVWIAATVFMLQLYADFSGCMDIILGASECYGVKLPENFKSPFAARTVQEYWQKWHVTLGAWHKNYILYPVMKSKLMVSLGDFAKKHFGKKTSKKVTSYISMLAVWLCIGFWHGGAVKYVIGNGIWFWLCIILERELRPLREKLFKKMNINEELISVKMLDSLKVLLLVSFGNIFFRLPSFRLALAEMGNAFSVWNPWALFDVNAVTEMGLSTADLNILIFGLAVLIIVGSLKNRAAGKDSEDSFYLRKAVSRQILPARWLLWLLLLAFVIIFGKYGPGYDAAAFIYEGF